MSDVRDPSVRLSGCRSVIIYTDNRPALACFRRQLDIVRAIVETTLPYRNPDEDRIYFRRGDKTVSFCGRSCQVSFQRGSEIFHFSIASEPEDAQEASQSAAIACCDEIDRIVTDSEKQSREIIPDSNQVLPELRLAHDLYQAAATAANLPEQETLILVGLLNPYHASKMEEFQIQTWDNSFTLRPEVNEVVKRSVPAGLLLSLDAENRTLTIDSFAISAQMGATPLLDQMRAINSFNLDPEDLTLIPTDEI